MNDISEIFELKFMESANFEEEKQKYFDALAEIKKFRDSQVPIVIEWVRVESPKIAYIYPTDEVVHPIYSESDGYGTVHIWLEDRIHNAGIEIERRYLSLDDELYPKIRVYDNIPDCIARKIFMGTIYEQYK